MQTTFNNTMREAFMNARVNSSAIGSKMVNNVIHAMNGKAGIKHMGRGWSANVSRRTLDKLTKEGVFA